MKRPSPLHVPAFYPSIGTARPRTKQEYADLARLAWKAVGRDVEVKVLPSGEIWSATINGVPSER